MLLTHWADNDLFISAASITNIQQSSLSAETVDIFLAFAWSIRNA